MSQFKPMLACSTIPKTTELKYPLMASPKLDGIRCLIIDGEPVSRNLKPIPNRHIYESLKALNLPNLDGELMLKGGDFNNVQSAVMSQAGKPDFIYMVFDYFNIPDRPFSERFVRLGTFLRAHNTEGLIELVEHEVVRNSDDLDAMYDKAIAHDFEGLIVRDLDGKYKFGRSTMRQGWMLKLKTFHDAEAKIVGFEELMHNENEAVFDKLGAQTRSSEQAGLIPAGVLGSLVVEYEGKQFKIGTGFDFAMRAQYWDMREKLIGHLVTFKYQELSKYGIPRFPVFKGLRNKADM